MERIKSKINDYKVVSLFSGIGGFDLGFEYNGFNIIWANDFDKYAVETYKKNIGNNIVHGDIRLLVDKVPFHDVLIAGFPCQPFSTLGELKGFEDERGTLFFVISQILKKCNTKVVVLENVKNIMNHDSGKTFKRIIQELNSLGYYTFSKVLNSADYGLPQRRNRAFIVGFLGEFFNGKDFNFPDKVPLKNSTQDLLEKDVNEKYFLSKKILKTILGKGTKNYIVNPTIDLPISKTLTASMHKMHRASQDNYFTDKINFEKYCSKLNIDKSNIRKLTPNECRKLQGFPSDWSQVVSDSQAYKQFGNAVSVDVIYYIAKEIHKYIDENKKFDWKKSRK
jgi:DNA (cytosine-5)-methyltransferase 1